MAAGRACGEICGGAGADVGCDGSGGNGDGRFTIDEDVGAVVRADGSGRGGNDADAVGGSCWNVRWDGAGGSRGDGPDGRAAVQFLVRRRHKRV
jgi:hypothetical protein